MRPLLDNDVVLLKHQSNIDSFEEVFLFLNKYINLQVISLKNIIGLSRLVRMIGEPYITDFLRRTSQVMLTINALYSLKKMK